MSIYKPNFPMSKIMVGAALALSTNLSLAHGNDRQVPNLRVVKTLDLTDAISKAEAHSNGKAIEAELESHRGRRVFEIDVITEKGLRTVLLDSETGVVIDVKKDRIETNFMRLFERNTLSAYRNSDLDLSTFIKAVETELSAKVESANLDTDDGVLYVEMDVLTETGERDVVVDPATGSIFWDDVD